MKNRKYIQPVTKTLETKMYLKDTRDNKNEQDIKKDSSNGTFESCLQSEIIEMRKDTKYYDRDY